MQSTKEGEPPIENEAGGIREVICEEAEADTVSRSVRVGIRRSKRWHRRRTKKKEKKISRRSIARLVKLHFSVLLRGARALSRANGPERETERESEKGSSGRAFSQLVCHKRSSRWRSEKKEKKRKQWEKKLRRRRVVQPYDDSRVRVSDSGVVVVVVEKSIIEYRRPKKTANERESVKFFQ